MAGKMPNDAKDEAAKRQGRLIALVIAGTAILYVAAQFIGGQLGLATRYFILFDLLALAGFLWALIVTFQVWRNSRDDQG